MRMPAAVVAAPCGPAWGPLFLEEVRNGPESSQKAALETLTAGRRQVWTWMYGMWCHGLARHLRPAELCRSECCEASWLMTHVVSYSLPARAALWSKNSASPWKG